MNPVVQHALTWIHVLSMVGTFGGLLAFQLFVPVQSRKDVNIAGRASKIFSILVTVGLLAGVLGYGMLRAHTFGPHYNGIIAVKFILLVAIGALLGMSKNPTRGDAFRKIALVLLAVAAFFGISLRA